MKTDNFVGGKLAKGTDAFSIVYFGQALLGRVYLDSGEIKTFEIWSGESFSGWGALESDGYDYLLACTKQRNRSDLQMAQITARGRFVQTNGVPAAGGISLVDGIALAGNPGKHLLVYPKNDQFQVPRIYWRSIDMTPRLAAQSAGSSAVKLTLDAPEERPYELERSADLTTWKSAGSASSMNGPNEIDPLPTSDQREFFRIRQMR